MRAYERFLEYVVIWTSSDEYSDTVPSAMREFDLAHKLVDDLKAIGVDHIDVIVGSHGHNNHVGPHAKIISNYNILFILIK